MSNLSSLLENEEVRIAEPELEVVSESDMTHLIAIALEEAAVEELSETPTNAIFEGVEVGEDNSIMEASIVKLDKNAKKQRAYKLAILQCAKDDDNKDYKKLETIWQMEKYLMRRLEKKYAQRARSRMKQTSKKVNGNGKAVVRAKKNLSGPKLTRSQRETQKALAGHTKPPSQIKSQFNTISQNLNSKIK